jgi:RNA polymerase sigma-70 factor (ECF subfamily)
VDDAARLMAQPHDPASARDEELARAARTDPDAFGILYDRHWLAVYRYLRTRTPTDDDAAELAAATFERALAAMPRYRPAGGGILAWLITIARNAAIDAGRRARPGPLDRDVTDDRAGMTPEDGVLTRERRATLAAAIAALPPDQREAISLRYAARLTAREIGAVLGKREQATQKLIERALATIREQYRADD